LITAHFCLHHNFNNSFDDEEVYADHVHALVSNVNGKGGDPLVYDLVLLSSDFAGGFDILLVDANYAISVGYPILETQNFFQFADNIILYS
jgi:hypothetical protein